MTATPDPPESAGDAVPRTRGATASSEGIVDFSSAPLPAGPVTADVVVIGSGCGGATAAWDLAAGGKQVVLLEEGGDFTGRALTQRDGEMIDQIYADRGGRATEDLSVSILAGRVLGGGGVINQCDVVHIQDEVLEVWSRVHGLTELTPANIAPHRARARADLSASRIEPYQVNRANQMLRAGTEALGLAGEVMEHNRIDCAQLGTCSLGCPVNAKRNPRFVAIPGAVAAGARVFTRARVVRIDDANQEIKRIQVRTLDAKGYRETGSFEVRAPVVVIAANAVGSAQLLLRSGIGNEQVGRHLSLQPQLPIVAEFDERLEAFYGVPQSYAVTEHEQVHETLGLWGHRIEAIMVTPGFAASLLPLAGHGGKEMMTRYPHFAASLLLVPDEPSGTVALKKSGRPLVRYEHLESHKSRIREAIKVGVRIYLAAGARTVTLPIVPMLQFTKESDLSVVDSLTFPPASAPFVSAHQQGGVRFAPSERDGAANPDGQVYGTRDVYVFDSSGYPSSASSHTMAPIITTSHFLSAALLSRIG